MSRYDVIIIGGGIAGISLAFELSTQLEVCVLERELTMTQHATGSAAAIVNETMYPAPIRELTSASRIFFENLSKNVEKNLLTPRPLLAFADQEHAAFLKQRAQDVAGLIPDSQLLLPHECVEVCPILRPDAAAIGLLEPRAMQMDVTGLHSAFRDGLVSKGGRIKTHSYVTSLQRHNGLWMALSADGTVVQAPIVANAAGAWADTVAELGGADAQGLRSYRRTQFLATSQSDSNHANSPTLIDAGGRFYLRPVGLDFLCSPMDESELKPADKINPDGAAIDRSLRDIDAATGLGRLKVTNAWAGVRTFTPSRLPVVGYSPKTPGFFWFAGLGDYGLQVSPALARIGSALLREVDIPGDLRRLSIDVKEFAPV